MKCLDPGILGHPVITLTVCQLKGKPKRKCCA